MAEAYDAVELTRRLVQIPSDNPTGTEAAIAAFVAEWLAQLPNVEVESWEVLPRRPNVIGRLRGTGSLPPLALVAHMDTVPFGEDWQRAPTSGEIIDGKLYGRGACDMKSGLAVAMTAIAAAARMGRRPSRDILLCATMDEEGTHMRGVNDLVDRGILDAKTLVVATEPSDLKLVVAHKGLVWMEVEVRGKLAHAGNPQFGVDAILAAAEFMVAFKRHISGLPHVHETLGCAEVTFSSFVGGIKTNVVPDHARLELDIRLPPPMTIEAVDGIVAEAANAAGALVPGAEFSFRRFNNERPPVEADTESSFAAALRSAIVATTGDNEPISVFPAYTDASVVQARTGNPSCFVFGPGRLAQAHTIDEYVPVDQIEKAARILDRLVADTCFAGIAA